ncbi:hypothetical protein BBJ28_00009732 [Nothophytophthora sp. Chile5]|nr:hypothetical protein BBJ28_00009732 [Nothophytophthora sp. Chile5]
MMARGDNNDGAEFLDERLAAEEPLLPLGSSLRRKEKARPWYRSRLTAVVGVALVLLGVAYGIVSSQIQRIATNAIKTTTMRIDQMDLSHPSLHQVTLDLRLALNSASVFPAAVDPATFCIMYQDQQVGSFLSPAMTIRHGNNMQIFPNATLQIANHSAWDAFARDMMRLPSVEYAIRGQLNIHVRLLGGLLRFSASEVPLEKNMSFNGMDGLREMQIAEVNMSNSTETQVLATIKTCIRNPSITTLRPVGALCLKAHYPTVGTDTLVAHLTTPADTSLTVANNQPSHPYCASLTGENMSTGYNLLELNGEMLGTNSEAISGLISKYLSNRAAELTVVTCEPQATSVDLYNHAMQNLSIPSSLPPQKDPLVGNMFFQGITLHAPEVDKANQRLRLDTSVKVEATSPLGPHSALTITDVHMKVLLTNGDAVLGSLSTLSVDIIDGKLVDHSNLSVNCLTELALSDNGKPFGEFVRSSVMEEKVALTLDGQMDVVCHGALGILKLSGLPLSTTAWLDGMNNFRDVTIEKFSLPGTGNSTEHGEAIWTQIKIRNPSVFAVSIGTLTMDLSLDQQSPEKFGQLHGEMNLTPGTNELAMSGRLNPSQDSKGRVSDAVAGFFSRYLQGKSSNVSVKITKTQYGDCIWMQEALLGLTIGTTFPGVEKGFQMISDISMRQLDVILDEAPPDERRSVTNTRMQVRTDMKAEVKMPASIKIPLGISNLSVALTLEDASSIPIGSLVSNREVCEFNQTDGGAFRLNMKHFYSIGFDDRSESQGMAEFVTNLLTKNESVMMRLATGSDTNQGAFPYAETRMGVLALSNIPVQGAPLIPAMDSFRHPPVKVLSVDIKRGSKASMTMAMTFALQNPSVVQIKLGALVLDVLFEGVRMGSAKMANFSLKCCGEATILNGIFEYNPRTADLAIAERFLSNFVCVLMQCCGGAFAQIAIKGSTESTPLDLLQPAMEKLTIPSKLPTLGELFPNTPTLVTSSLLYIPSLFHLTQIPTALELRNPFSESITVTTVDLELYPCEDQASGQ